MFNVSYESAKHEVARRHERLVEAQRSGLAYEYRPRKPGPFARFANSVRRQKANPVESPAQAQGEPCVTC